MHAFSHIEIIKMARRYLDRSPSVHALIVAASIVAFSIEIYIFARVQDIWLDESTQLSGITLNIWELFRWLAGADQDRLGVPEIACRHSATCSTGCGCTFAGPRRLALGFFILRL